MINRQPSSLLLHFLFWFESFLLVTITALMTFLVLKDDPPLPFVVYGIVVVASSSLIGCGTVLFLAVRTRQIKKSFYMGAGIVLTGEYIAIFVNTLLVNPLWNAQRPPCQIQCGNSAIIGSLEIFWPVLCMFPGVAAAGVASFLGWVILRLQRRQESQIKAESR